VVLRCRPIFRSFRIQSTRWKSVACKMTHVTPKPDNYSSPWLQDTALALQCDLDLHPHRQDIPEGLPVLEDQCPQLALWPIPRCSSFELRSWRTGSWRGTSLYHPRLPWLFRASELTNPCHHSQEWARFHRVSSNQTLPTEPPVQPLKSMAKCRHKESRLCLRMATHQVCGRHSPDLPPPRVSHRHRMVPEANQAGSLLSRGRSVSTL